MSLIDHEDFRSSDLERLIVRCQIQGIITTQGANELLDLLDGTIKSI